MNIRNVSIKDYGKIKALLKRHNLNLISYERWINLWKKNPSLKNNRIKWIKGWVIENNKKIVGHVGQFPMLYFLNKKSYLCSVIYGWAVDERFRSLSILLLKRYFSQTNVDLFLATNLNETSSKIMKMLKVKEVPTKSLNYSLVVALNLRKVIKVFFRNIHFPFKKLILSIFSPFLIIFLKKKLNSWKNKLSTGNIVKQNEIDGKFDLVWKKITGSQKNKLLFRRDKKWLKWHLNYFIKNRKAWIYFSIKNKKINGYSICIEKNNLETGIKSALLIDLNAFKEPNKTSINLIGANIMEAKRRNCDIFEFRGFDNEKISYMNSFDPFKKKLLINTFCYKTNNKKLNKLLAQSKYWCPSYLDGDAIMDF
jgi:hypothetical protein